MVTGNMFHSLKNSSTIRSRPACNYLAHECSGQRVEGYDYCVRHILEDKTAPYRLCGYVYSGNGRRCIMPTPKGDKRESGFCAEHARKAQLARQKSSRRHIPPPSSESLLLSLSHYSKTEYNSGAVASGGGSRKSVDNGKRFMGAGNGNAGSQLDTGQSSLDVKESDTQEDAQDFVTKALNPYVDMDALKVNSAASRILDYASESDSDVEVTVQGETAENASSDAESVDSHMEDPFKHAGVYTTEEVTLVTRDKLIRLQSLYIEQFRRLQHVLKERRRRYLHALKREKETLSSIYNQSRESVREQKLYEKLRSLNHYHKRSGVEAVLHKKALERRAHATEGVNIRPAPTAKCVFTEGGVKCGERTLPVAKHCLKHILEDTHQVLFRPCGCRRADFVCREPVPNILEGASCVYHTNLPLPPPPLPAANLGLKIDDSGGEEAMETSLSHENDSEVEISRMSSSSTQDAHQFGNHMTPKQNINDPGKIGELSSIIDKTMDGAAQKAQESKGECDVDDMTVGETEVITNSETDMVANST
ncbi:KAT8 regulatory NSL complex subunit 2 isoform X2 [Zootermopsis nevadensis]|nr:KAT8 regulatory NSL complex subunit 2 isoform X2 [Zootermopsis nevadensis]